MLRLLTLLVFVLGSSLGFLSVNTIDRLIAHRAIERDARELADKFHLFVTQAREDISRLPPHTEEICSEELRAHLVEEAFDAVFIRWLALVKDGQILCQSSEMAHDFSRMTRHRLGEGFTLAVPPAGEDDHHELFLIRHLEGYDYVASIQPLHPRFFIHLDCEGCLAYDVEFATDPPISFRNEYFDSTPTVQFDTTHSTPDLTLRFDLRGNEGYLSQFLHLGDLLAALLGAVAGLLFAALFWFWQSKRQSLAGLMKQGIRRREFVPFYQPIVATDSGELKGCEVLVRWRRPDGSLVPPNQFIPAAEANGLVRPITRVMMDRMLEEIAEHGGKANDLFFSVNIVPEHLEDEAFLAYLEEIVRSGRLGGNRLSLELTERMPIRDLEAANQRMERLRAMGIDFKLDDAGTGYGSFSYVQRLGISTLKIDKMFVDTLQDSDNFKNSTLTAIISFVTERRLGMIAEGVETRAQYDCLKALGVDYIQGYFFSKPLEATAFFSWTPAAESPGNTRPGA